MATTTNALAPKTPSGRPSYRVVSAAASIITGAAFAGLPLSARARQVLAYYARRSRSTNGDARCYESKRKIAAKLDCSERTLVRRIAELVALGLLEYAGQARSMGNGRFMNGHLRLTRRACDELGLTWLGTPGPTDAKALDGVHLIPPAPRSRTRKAVAASAAPKVEKRPHGAPRMASGHVVGPSGSSSCTFFERHSPAPTTARASPTERAFIPVGGLMLPRELVWLCHNGKITPKAVAALMRDAKARGQRLTDVVTVAQPNLAGKEGRHLFAYLRRLITKPFDFAFVARQRAEAQAAKATAQAEAATFAKLRGQLAGRWLQLPDGRYGQVTGSAEFVEVWKGSERCGSSPLDAAFLREVQKGNVAQLPVAPALLAERTEPAARSKPDFAALKAAMRGH